METPTLDNIGETRRGGGLRGGAQGVLSPALLFVMSSKLDRFTSAQMFLHCLIRILVYSIAHSWMKYQW